eukprot:COSAG05_NODE_1340_length_5141_cov_2.211226_2_plen_463_part_00
MKVTNPISDERTHPPHLQQPGALASAGAGVLAARWSPKFVSEFTGVKRDTQPRILVGLADATAFVVDVASLGRVRHVAESPRRRPAAAGGTQDGVQIVSPDVHCGAIQAVDWSPDGSRALLASADSTVSILDTNTWAIVWTIKGLHRNAILCASFSADGSSVLLGSADATVSIVELDVGGWRLASIIDVHASGSDAGAICDARWSPDGSKIALGSADGTASVVSWTGAANRKAATWSLLKRLPTGWASGDGGSYNGDSSTGTTDNAAATSPARDIEAASAPLPPHGGERSKLAINSVCWSPDGHRLAFGCQDSSAIVIDVASWATIRTIYAGRLHAGPITAVDWSADGFRLLLGSADQSASVVDTATWSRLRRIDLTAAGGAGLEIAASSTRSANSNISRAGIDRGDGRHSDSGKSILCARFNPDGSRVLLGAADGTSTIVDMATLASVTAGTGASFFLACQ